MKLRTIALATLAFALPALAAQLKTDATKSSVSAVFKQMNVPVEGKFKRFNAQIDYNSAKPETSKASMEIEVASFDLGDADFNKEAQKKDWFNGPQFPKATFVSSALKPAAGGKLDVSGKLTIKGKTADVAFPLTVKQEGTTQVFEGALPIKRLAFSIGEGEWKDTSMVADEVVIKFRVVATQ
ncbi:YceI family protein [Noviherbaspirillum denitrificans]|uniref:Polyisoprenoid-binding protein n=1 Tax=Noviherbaspirillum denitrificans TaxID=1968433 RepID=A0A254TCE0_9BURK|nr:YceI family protein [Noviherbaspirillum denitrificans]OWW20225.1 polyisoprenoid-binding protein [Noviherbaspirillum denitrificans]